MHCRNVGNESRRGCPTVNRSQQSGSPSTIAASLSCAAWQGSSSLTTQPIFIIHCEPRFMPPCRKVDSNTLLSIMRGISLGHVSTNGMARKLCARTYSGLSRKVDSPIHLTLVPTLVTVPPKTPSSQASSIVLSSGLVQGRCRLREYGKKPRGNKKCHKLHS